MKNIVTDAHTTNQTLLTPFLQRFVYNWLLELIPRGIPANYITLTSLAAIGTGFVLSHQAAPQAFWVRALIAAMLFLYLLCDDLDGLQARRTGTQSSLGEFLDHYSDSLCLGASSVILLNCLPPTLPYLWFAHLTGVYLVITTTFYSQHQTRHLHLHEISAPEALFLYSILIILTGTDWVHDWFYTPLGNLLTVADVFISLLTIVYVYYGIKNILSCPNGLSVRFYVYLLGGIVTTWFCLPMQDVLTANVLIVWYHGVYIGHLISTKVTGQKEPFPIVLIPAYLLVQYVTQSQWMWAGLPVVAGVQIGIYLYTFFQTFRQFRNEWKWYHPNV